MNWIFNTTATPNIMCKYLRRFITAATDEEKKVKVNARKNFKFLSAIIGLAIAVIAGLLYWRKKREF